MSDDLKVAAELSLKDNLTGPASKAVARVSGEARKAAGEQARSASAARGMADALAQVDRRGQAAARAVGGVAQAMARAAHTPFTTAAAQMQNLQQATITELDDSLTRAQKNAAHTETAGGLVGTLAGAKAGAVGGAALGSLAGPIGTAVGTALGGLLGGAAGFFGGGRLGEKLGNWAFGGDDKAGEAPPLQETVMQAVQLMRSAPIAANLNLTVELDGEVIARKVEQAQLRQATRR